MVKYGRILFLHSIDQTQGERRASNGCEQVRREEAWSHLAEAEVDIFINLPHRWLSVTYPPGHLNGADPGRRLQLSSFANFCFHHERDSIEKLAGLALWFRVVSIWALKDGIRDCRHCFRNSINRLSNHPITPIIDEEVHRGQNAPQMKCTHSPCSIPFLTSFQHLRCPFNSWKRLNQGFSCRHIVTCIPSGDKKFPYVWRYAETMRLTFLWLVSCLIVLSQLVVVREHHFQCNIAVATSQSCFRIARDPSSFSSRMVELPDSVALRGVGRIDEDKARQRLKSVETARLRKLVCKEYQRIAYNSIWELLEQKSSAYLLLFQADAYKV